MQDSRGRRPRCADLRRAGPASLADAAISSEQAFVSRSRSRRPSPSQRRFSDAGTGSFARSDPSGRTTSGISSGRSTLTRSRTPRSFNALRYVRRHRLCRSTPPDTRYILLQLHVGFCRFLADNLAAFDYKTQEEVFVVVERLTAIISVTGVHIFDLLSRARLDFADGARSAEGQRVAVQVIAHSRGLQQLTDSSSEADEVRQFSLRISLRALADAPLVLTARPRQR